jgi:hypothetical protein
MRLRKQNQETGYFQFGHNGADIWYNQVEGVGQLVKTRLLLYAGEWFLDISEGTPWGGFPLNPQVVAKGQILAEHTALSRDAALRVRVLATPGVQSIVSYASQTDPNTRTFSVQMVIETLYGRLAMSIEPAASYASHWLIHYSALTGADPL